MTAPSDDLLRLDSVGISLPAHSPQLVRDVSFSVRRGECLGLVGESGSGKSLLLRSILGLLPAPLRRTGSIVWRSEEGEEGESAAGRLRGREIAMIFQEPMRALNPVRKVSWTLAEPLGMRHGLRGRELRERVMQMLRDVGIADALRVSRSYPHELSGGLQQRVMIAAALCTEPRLLLCDEPTTALDVTTQARIVDLLQALQEERNLSMLFVSHDLALVSQLADRVAVLRQGQLLELGNVDDILFHPAHSYTQSLLDALPDRGERAEEPPTRRQVIR